MSKFERGYIIDWFGPFESFSEARKFSRDSEYYEGIYVIFGHEGAKNAGRPRLRYIGLTSNFVTRLTSQHRESGLTNIKSVWLGITGDFYVEDKIDRTDIKACEWTLVHALGPDDNDRLNTPPEVSCTITNNYWKPNSASLENWTQTGRANKPAYLPSIVYYDAWAESVWYIDFDKRVVSLRQN